MKKLQVFKFGTKDGEPADHILKEHSYLLQPVTGQAKYSKLRLNEVAESNQPLHKAVVNLDDVTICLSKVHLIIPSWFSWSSRIVVVCLYLNNLHRMDTGIY